MEIITEAGRRVMCNIRIPVTGEGNWGKGLFFTEGEDGKITTKMSENSLRNPTLIV